jgi:hypothetical protein
VFIFDDVTCMNLINTFDQSLRRVCLNSRQNLKKQNTEYKYDIEGLTTKIYPVHFKVLCVNWCRSEMSKCARLFEYKSINSSTYKFCWYQMDVSPFSEKELSLPHLIWIVEILTNQFTAYHSWIARSFDIKIDIRLKLH